MRRGLQVILIFVLVFAFYYFGFGFVGKTAGTIVSVFSTLTIISLCFMISMENRNPSTTMSWILLLALVPIVGLIVYFLFGQNFFNRRKYDKKAIIDMETYERLENEELRFHQDYSGFTTRQQQLLKLSQKLGRSPISHSTETTVLTNGEQTFSKIINELEAAKHHIHMEYYIFRADDIGTRIQEILIKKAKLGVEIRFMYDAVGSIQIPKPFLKEMVDAGVKVVAFGSVKTNFFSSRVNFRNHRKIVVIDGNVGFIGGLNVGDEYLSRSKTYGFWRDTHMLVKGEAVRTLQIIFLRDWLYMTGEQFLQQEYLSPVLSSEGDGIVQMIASGPDNERRVLRNLFFAMITSAEKSVWLATPYFIPDDDILTALKVAALSGIDVRILFPAKPDKKLPFYASHSYFPVLLETGVKIYEYEKGFIHSKLLIVDGELATIGTANMDMRSLNLNFEVNALLLKTCSVQKMVTDFERDLLSTNQLSLEQLKSKKLWERILESSARLMSPLL
ncbi:cardiolipin synthase [Paenibacillus crassostreae]|uniref:Cardiolipin synthase n=1 Tax=Paenibacillus crassostreae TaxID=1763538 RepID=A0A167B443_9BACL|nr:cardiolipin synthase [Paenibacillus crassostreae]AOZ93185.1 cardiolipin synthase [Paenibacillus crassostreae]OAB71724.1 cardiolipin synthase [Paenibacillus crassostreae]